MASPGGTDRLSCPTAKAPLQLGKAVNLFQLSLMEEFRLALLHIFPLSLAFLDSRICPQNMLCCRRTVFAFAAALVNKYFHSTC